MVTNPIWKDTIYQTSASTLQYRINVDGNTVFSGRAYKMPNASNLEINVNRICQNYLSNELPLEFTGVTATTSYPNDNAVKDFVLLDNNGNELETYRFYYDWGYDEGTSQAINNHYASGQFKFVTTRNNEEYINTITIQGESDYCGDYAMYYLDSYGCWQSFLFEGKTRKFNNFTQYEYNRSFNNTTVEFERGRYISEIETRYELGTGWLTDSESENFARNLVGTNMAYLHNLSTGRIFPVVIDESEIEYKKFKNDRQLIEYVITVVDSQNKIRK